MNHDKEKIYAENKEMNDYFISRIKIISIYISKEQIKNELDCLLKKTIDLYLKNGRTDRGYKFSSYYSSFVLDYLNDLTKRALISKSDL